jgi:anti-anti-sigma factor
LSGSDRSPDDLVVADAMSWGSAMTASGTSFGAIKQVAGSSGKAYELGLVLGPRGARVSLAGEIDMSAAPDLTRLMSSLQPLAMPILVDLSAVTFLDSSGATPLFEASRQREARNQHPVELVDCGPRACQFFELVGLEPPVLDVDVWDAITRS